MCSENRWLCTQIPDMKIKKISVYQKDLPLSEPYWLSGGRLK